MPGSFSRQEIESLVAGVDAGYRVVRHWPLTGGVSAQIAAIEVIAGPGRTTRIVARMHGEWERQHNPDIARHEFTLLHRLHAAGRPVPAPIAVDVLSCEAPVLIVEYLPGKALSSPADAPHDPLPVVRQAARMLRSIHEMDISALSFLPDNLVMVTAAIAMVPESPNEEFSEQAIFEALRDVWPPLDNTRRLLHGDFWPGNLLYEAGELKGVLDWEEAALGSRLADLAIARLELAWMWGAEAANEFTECYCTGSDVDLGGLIAWDLFAALRMARGIPNWGFSAADRALAREGHARFIQLIL